ncbi:uncharacterized protein LOC131233636 isoform X2 [Magnolia sinica]|uniref:uncharacterized protein LOC131233636 isoform X2 n=1 Tax=Magnolia sinica TaxID=86752 RepID=UPI00265813A9|nr:uncharacterized protein LOC131233636 isoform X2 [Magnolia sinica]
MSGSPSSLRGSSDNGIQSSNSNYLNRVYAREEVHNASPGSLHRSMIKAAQRVQVQVTILPSLPKIQVRRNLDQAKTIVEILSKGREEEKSWRVKLTFNGFMSRRLRC